MKDVDERFGMIAEIVDEVRDIRKIQLARRVKGEISDIEYESLMKAEKESAIRKLIVICSLLTAK